MGHVGEETQITCRFVTKLPDEYKVPLSSVVRTYTPALQGFDAAEYKGLERD